MLCLKITHVILWFEQMHVLFTFIYKFMTTKNSIEEEKDITTTINEILQVNISTYMYNLKHHFN